MSILSRLRRSALPAPAKTEPEGPRSTKRRPLTRAELVAAVGLSLPALGGAYLSWHGMSEAAGEALGDPWSGYVVPAVVDGAILGAAVRWVTAVRAGRRAGHWRAWTHLCVALTVGLNAYASESILDSPWHVAAPLIWSGLVELLARDAAGEHDAEAGRPADRIPLRLWVSAPREQWRAALRMARTNERSAKKARAEADAGRAAIRALRLVLPRRFRDRAVRVELRSRVLAGSLTALEVFELIDRMAPDGSDGMDGSVALSAPDRALLETLRTAATRGGSAGTDGMDGSDGRTDGRSDGSVTHSERVGMDGSDGWPERLRPIGSDGGAVRGMDRPVSALNGSANGSRAVSGVRSGGRRRSSGDPDAARPGDVDTAHALQTAGHLGATPTADEIVSAFREHSAGLGLGNARNLREYLEREHRQTA